MTVGYFTLNFVVKGVNQISFTMHIRGPNDEVTPLALFLPKLGTEPRLVTSTDIDKVMRNTASRVYNLDPVRHKTELQRWSSHSLRVGV
jgi:hypothetical protein